jgi:hypothetical protein
MSSKLSDRSDEENQRNLERFSPLLYQLKQSGDSNGQTHSKKCDIIGQVPGSYPYPSGDQRQSPNNVEEEEVEENEVHPNGACFKPKKLL